MPSTKRRHSPDTGLDKWKKEVKGEKGKYNDETIVTDRHSAKYDGAERKGKKDEDLRSKLKRIKQEKQNIPNDVKPVVQLDHLRTDDGSDCRKISKKTNLLRRETTSDQKTSVTETPPVKNNGETSDKMPEKEGQFLERYESRHFKNRECSEIEESPVSDSEESSSNTEDYEALANLIKKQIKSNKKKKRRRNNYSTDEESSIQRKRRTKKKSESLDEELCKEETKTRKSHQKNSKKDKKRKKKKYEVESSSQDEDSQLAKSRKNKTKKEKKKKEKKRRKKKKKQTFSESSSSSDEDTSDDEEDLIKIRKVKEIKRKLLLEMEKEEVKSKMENRFDLLRSDEKLSRTAIKNKKVLSPISDSEPYFDSEAEAALQKAKGKLNTRTEKKTYKRRDKERDLGTNKVERKIEQPVNEKERKKELEMEREKERKEEREKEKERDETSIRHVRYCKDDRKSSIEKRSITMDKSTAIKNKIMNNMRNKTSENKKHSSNIEDPCKEIHVNSKHLSDPVGESRRSSTYLSIQRKSTSRSTREKHSLGSTSYSEKLDQLVNERIDQIYETKRKSDKITCCNFCGISNHRSEECRENKLNGRNSVDIYGGKLECSQCGSFNHLVDTCIHTEARGSNPFGFDGKKFKCGHCGSFDHKTNGCAKIHCEKLGKNPIGISGRKIACDQCNSFDHFGNDCTGLASGKLSKKHEAACEHCGSFSHGAENCKETRGVISYKSNRGLAPSCFPPNIQTKTQELKFSEDSSDCFYQLPVEEELGQCKWCKSDIHCLKTCPVKHDQEYGKNPLDENRVMLHCLKCGSFNHLVNICFHSMANGKNPAITSGNKLSCIICGSYNHTYHCKDKDLEKNGRNPTEADGKKYRCDCCGSFDHLTRFCNHTESFGKNLYSRLNGKKKRCPYCGSYDHDSEKLCMQLCDQTREFLRRKMGFDKMKRSSGNSLNLNERPKFSNIMTNKTNWLEKKCPIVVDLDNELTSTEKGNKKKSRWGNYREMSASENCFNGSELSQEEKVEQIDAERKMKERLMAKFKMIDPNFFGSGNSSQQQTSKESSPISQEIESMEEKIEVYEEEIMDEMVYDEPDESIFNDVELRIKTDRFPRITTNMHNDIVSAMTGQDDNIISAHNINITKHDLYGLTGQNWLNDKVIEFYLQMVAARSLSLEYRELNMPRIHCMSTYFFLNLIMRGYGALERWTKDVDIFSFDILLVPVHMDMHWCIAIIDFRSPGVFYYDSMGGHNMPALSAILSYLKEEHLNKKGTELDLRHFAKEVVPDCPQQQNGSDCGIFVCKVAEYLSRETVLSFDQEDMAYFRKRMIWEMIKVQLLSP